MCHPHKALLQTHAETRRALNGTRSRAVADCRTPLTRLVRTAADVKGLGAIFDESIDGVIWDRRLPAFVLPALRAVAAQPSAESRLRVSLREIDNATGAFLHDLGFKSGPAQDWMAKDIAILANQFGKILFADQIALRAEIVRDDACRKFHRDAVRARIICTYTGPGTEYGIADPGQEPDHVEVAPTGCPILLKGKAWSGVSQGAVTHRSPPIEGTGTSRLVVVIDAATP